MLAKGIEVELEDNSVSDSGSASGAEVRLARRKEQRRPGKSSKSSSGIVVDNKLDSAVIVSDKKEHQDSSRIYLQRIARGTSRLANELASTTTTTTTKANKQTARGCPIEIDKWSDFGPLKNEAFQLQHCNNIDRDIVANSNVDDSAQSVVVGEPAGHSLVIEEEAGSEKSISLIGYQLLTLILGLLLLLYLFDVAQRLMTNLLSKILGGGERRRSLANNAQQRGRQQGQQQEDPQMLQAGIAQSHSSSTLSLPRNSSPIIGASSNQRRSSRSSIHSVSALFISAFTGGGGGNSSAANSGQSSMNNGNALFSR